MTQTSFRLSEFFNYYVGSQEATEDSIYSIKLSPTTPSEPIGFYPQVALKKEFHSYQATAQDKLTSSSLLQGKFMPHQEFIARYLAPYTPYNRLLAFHGVGTGKTALYTNVAEVSKQIYDSQNMFDFKVVVLTRKVLVSTAYLEIGFKYLDGKYLAQMTNEEYNDYKTSVPLGKEIKSKEQIIEERTIRNVKKLYTIMSYNDMAKKLLNASTSSIQEQFHHTLLILDEVHNLKSKDDDDNQKVDKYNLIKNRLIPNILQTDGKVLLLSATPMIDTPQQIVPLLNLLLPVNDQLDDGMITRIVEDRNNEDIMKFKQRTRGIVSYVRPMIQIQIKFSGINRTRFNATISVNSTIIQVCPMSQFQEADYEKLFADAFGQDIISDDESSIEELEERLVRRGISWRPIEEAAAFVWPNQHAGSEAERQYINVDTLTLKNSMMEALGGINSSVETKLKHLQRFSCKAHFVLSQLLSFQNQKSFIYCEIVNGGGVYALAAILKFFGYDQLTENTSVPGRRFMLIAGDYAKNVERLLKTFNSVDNMHGELCQVVIGSEIAGEGISFLQIRKMFFFTPHWNEATMEQAMGRSIRSNSHALLPTDEQNITIYKLAAVPHSYAAAQSTNSVDIYMYSIAEIKDRQIKYIERLLKEVAVDCSLNRRRNILPAYDNESGSKNCDYQQECQYACQDIPAALVPLQDYRGPLINDTYNLYYAQQEMIQIKEKIKGLFSKKNAYDYDELYSHLAVDFGTISSIILARTLNELISSNESIYNRLGFLNYLRTDSNMYFLVDDPLNGSMYSLSWYADHPVPNVSLENFEMQYEQFYSNRIPEIIQQITELSDDQITSELIQNTFNLIDADLRSSLISTAIQAVREGGNVPKYLRLISDTFGILQQITQQTEQEQETALLLLLDRANIYGHYGILAIKSATDQTFKIKDIKIPRLKFPATLQEPFALDGRDLKYRDGKNCSSYGKVDKIRVIIDLVEGCNKTGIVPPFVTERRVRSRESSAALASQIISEMNSVVEAGTSEKGKKATKSSTFWTMYDVEKALFDKYLNEHLEAFVRIEYPTYESQIALIEDSDSDIKKKFKAGEIRYLIDENLQGNIPLYLSQNEKIRAYLLLQPAFRQYATLYDQTTAAAQTVWSSLLGIPLQFFKPNSFAIAPSSNFTAWIQRQYLQNGANGENDENDGWNRNAFRCFKTLANRVLSYSAGGAEGKEDKVDGWICSTLRQWFKSNDLLLEVADTGAVAKVGAGRKEKDEDEEMKEPQAKKSKTKPGRIQQTIYE